MANTDPKPQKRVRRPARAPISNATLKSEHSDGLESTDEAAPKSISAEVAKWLVPSATALFAVIGYLVSVAQARLLGLSADGLDPNAYVSSAAQFFLDAPRLISQAMQDPKDHGGVLLAAHGRLLIISVLFSVLALGHWPLATTLKARWPWARHLAWMAPTVLLLLVAGKFSFLDAPLGAIVDVVLSEPLTSDVALKASDALDLLQPRDDQAGGFTNRTRDHQQTFAERLAAEGPNGDRLASGLWTDLLCSRITIQDPASLPLTPGLAACDRDRSHYARALRAEFLAHLAMAALIAVLAAAILRSATSTPFSISVALLAIAYSLTAANAYGKLMKPTDFNYGVVRLTTPVKASAGAAEPDRLEGLILSQGATGSQVLVVEHATCAQASPGSTVHPELTAVRLSWISNNQIASVQEIFRQDVISWAVLNERRCPPTSPESDHVKP